MVVSAIGSLLGTLIHTNEKNWDGSIRLFYRFRVAIDITKSLKKQMKLKKDNGTWAVIDFRYERLPTFCFLRGVIGHGDRYCPKFVNGYDCNLEKPFGARMRAGSRRTAPTSGQRWVALETDADRASWKSPTMEAVESEAVSETFAKGKEPMVTATGNGVAGVPSSDSQHADIPTVVVSVQKRRRSDEGASIQGSDATMMDYWLDRGDSQQYARKHGVVLIPGSSTFGLSSCVGEAEKELVINLADLSHRRRVCSGVVQETADQPSTVVDVSPAVASAQPRRRFPSPSRLLPGTVASQPSLLPRKKVDTDLQLRSLARLNGEAVTPTGSEKVDTDLQLRSLARLNGEAVTPTGSGSVYSLFSALMGGVVGVVVWFR
nr:uncharacterized protein LOC109174453 [Ipomoea batatas]